MPWERRTALRRLLLGAQPIRVLIKFPTIFSPWSKIEGTSPNVRPGAVGYRFASQRLDALPRDAIAPCRRRTGYATHEYKKQWGVAARVG